MRVVLDTNVIISGLINPEGAPAQILNLVITKKIKLLYDNRILEEYLSVLLRKKFQFDREWVIALIDFIKHEGIFVLTEPIQIIFIDNEDKKFYEVAKSGDALYLVTGNKKHYPEEKMVIIPKDFILKIFQ